MRRVIGPLTALLQQGVTAEKLALSLALGAVIGIFPVPGVTTLMCVVAAILLRVNHIAIQLANWIVYPLMLVMLVPYVRLGEFLLGADPFPLVVREFAAQAKNDPRTAIVTFAEALGSGMVGWGATAPLTVAIFFFVFRPLMRRLRPAR